MDKSDTRQRIKKEKIKREREIFLQYNKLNGYIQISSSNGNQFLQNTIVTVLKSITFKNGLARLDYLAKTHTLLFNRGVVLRVHTFERIIYCVIIIKYFFGKGKITLY